MPPTPVVTEITKSGDIQTDRHRHSLLFLFVVFFLLCSFCLDCKTSIPKCFIERTVNPVQSNSRRVDIWRFGRTYCLHLQRSRNSRRPWIPQNQRCGNLISRPSNPVHCCWSRWNPPPPPGAVCSRGGPPKSSVVVYAIVLLISTGAL
jgi:hypothetical protein